MHWLLPNKEEPSSGGGLNKAKLESLCGVLFLVFLWDGEKIQQRGWYSFREELHDHVIWPVGIPAQDLAQQLGDVGVVRCQDNQG